MTHAPSRIWRLVSSWRCLRRSGQGCALRGRQEEAEPPRLWRYCGGVKGGRGYMYIPLMATASHGQIGAPNAESFCERTLRGRLASGHVLKEGNTLLADEMLVISST